MASSKADYVNCYNGNNCRTICNMSSRTYTKIHCSHNLTCFTRIVSGCLVTLLQLTEVVFGSAPLWRLVMNTEERFTLLWCRNSAVDFFCSNLEDDSQCDVVDFRTWLLESLSKPYFCSDRASAQWIRRVKSVTPELSHVVLSFASRSVFLRLVTQCLQLRLVHGHRIITKRSQSSFIGLPRTPRRPPDSNYCVTVTRLHSYSWITSLGYPTPMTHCRVTQSRHPASRLSYGRLVTFKYSFIYLYLIIV